MAGELDLTPIEAASGVATPRPWTWSSQAHMSEEFRSLEEQHAIYPPLGFAGPVALVAGAEDTAFIIAACNSADDLVAEIHRLRALVAELEDRLDDEPTPGRGSHGTGLGMNDIPPITAFRAAAAKLGEALAYTGTSPNGAAAIISEAEALAGGHLTPQGEGIGFFGNWRDHYNSHYGGWRWIVETAQLRLLVEARYLELEQHTDSERSRQAWKDAELGALVRGLAEGVK